MNYEKFFIPAFNISFIIPDNWIKSMEDESTCLFFDENRGSFRLTPVRIDDPNFDLDCFLQSEYNDNQNLQPVWLNWGDLKLVYYTHKARNEDDTIIHSFVAGKDNVILIMSFSYDTSLGGSVVMQEELKKVEATISSLSIDK